MNFVYLYRLAFLRTIIYMLQASDYNIRDYVKWLQRTKDFRRVAKRGELAPTHKARALYVILAATYVVLLLLAILCLAIGFSALQWGWTAAGLALFVATPWLLSYSVAIPLAIGERLIQQPREKVLIAEATKKVAAHKAMKIAIAGSFGKTTFKEILTTVLSEGHKAASTPGNLNTPLGTCLFVERLEGDEATIVFELGESHVGDVKQLCEITQPDIGVITGINEAHLSSFGSIEHTVETVFELEDYLQSKPLYKNKESRLVASRIESGDTKAYSRSGVSGWTVSDINTSIEGTHFTAHKANRKVHVHSGLLGVHQVGPLVACIAIADELGLTTEQIEAGIARTVAFEHRLQPRHMGGAWIIDDTYNGNIQGVEAGLDFLRTVEATRKIYVTPGLVEQGSQTAIVHRTLGQLASHVDMVVLMKNSVTHYMIEGLETAGFTGKLKIVDDPLAFYESIDQFIAKGDVVLMQNDWTDNYA